MSIPIFGSAKESSGISEGSSESSGGSERSGVSESSASESSASESSASESSAPNPFGTLEIRITNGDWGFFTRLSSAAEVEPYVTGPTAITNGEAYSVDLAAAHDVGAVVSSASFSLFAEWDSSDPTADDLLEIQVIYLGYDQIKSRITEFNPFKPEPPANILVATIAVDDTAAVTFDIAL
jgi:hypothetical protein